MMPVEGIRRRRGKSAADSSERWLRILIMLAGLLFCSLNGRDPFL